MQYFQRTNNPHPEREESFALYDCASDSLRMDSIVQANDERLLRATPVHSFFGNCLLRWSSDPELTIWDASRNRFDEKSRCYTEFNLLLKCNSHRIQLKEETLLITPEMSLSVCKKFFGFATQILLEDNASSKMLYWFWHYGQLEKVLDVVNSDDYLEPEDHYLWAVEMARLIAEATQLKAFLKLTSPSVLIQ